VSSITGVQQFNSTYTNIARHFINDPTHLVLSALKSVALANPSVALDAENKIIYRRPNHSPQVSLVSGGGSGHEPSFAAFVGAGLLSGAVAGTIFASPSAEQVRRCLLNRIDSSKGVLVIVMNYTGDVLNFGMAVEKAKASGHNVGMVVVGDDAGVGRAAGGKVGRRGIAGTVLVQKIAGALAATGYVQLSENRIRADRCPAHRFRTSTKWPSLRRTTSSPLDPHYHTCTYRAGTSRKPRAS